MRVLGGPFAGRVGVVSELDGKGGARVTLGLLQAWVPLEGLGPSREGARRPALRSSHLRFDLPSAADAASQGSEGSSSGRRKSAQRTRGK